MGKLTDYSEVEYSHKVINNCIADLNITFLSLCDCLTIEPSSRTIKPGDSFTFKITLTPEGYGTMSRHFLVDENGIKSTLRVYAELPETPVESLSNGCPECREKEIALAEAESAKKLMDQWRVADIYYSPGCTTCEEFISEVEEEVTLNKHNILEPMEVEALEKRLFILGVEMKAFPILISDDSVLQGEDVTAPNFRNMNSKQSGKLEPKTGITDKKELIKPIPVFLAGLLDGINPCAFTTLLFLISSLFYIGRGRKEILKTGIIFSLTIFLSYYLVGLGMLNIVRTAVFFPSVSKIIKNILIAALGILAILSFYDAYKVKKGSAAEMKLQLPPALKKRIHKTIKSNTRNRGLVIGTVITGVMVTIFELTCTGQVYLPIITYIVKIEGTISSYFYLTLYNLGFIIPLLIVFITVYRGTTNQTLAKWFTGKLFIIKILLGLLFMAMIPFI